MFQDQERMSSFITSDSVRKYEKDKGDKQMRGRKPSENSKYYLPPKQYAYVVSYALMRDEWAAEVRSIRDQSRAIRYDKDKVQSNNCESVTEAAAIDVLELESKIEKIDRTIEKVSEGLEDYIKLAVCNGFTFTQLTTGRHHMPINQNKFGEIKHKFYYELYMIV